MQFIDNLISVTGVEKNLSKVYSSASYELVPIETSAYDQNRCDGQLLDCRVLTSKYINDWKLPYPIITYYQASIVFSPLTLSFCRVVSSASRCICILDRVPHLAAFSSTSALRIKYCHMRRGSPRWPTILRMVTSCQPCRIIKFVLKRCLTRLMYWNGVSICAVTTTTRAASVAALVDV